MRPAPCYGSYRDPRHTVPGMRRRGVTFYHYKRKTPKGRPSMSTTITPAARAMARERSDSRIPDFKAPPRRYVEEAKTERARRKACHGSWAECSPECSREIPL